MTAADGNDLYAWQVQEVSGDWSMVGVLMPDPLSRALATHTPLIHRKREVVEKMRDLAQNHASGTGQPLRLARFTVSEVLEGGGQ